jgi:hypothetical protein
MGPLGGRGEPGPELSAYAHLAASLDGLTGEMRAQRQREEDRRRLFTEAHMVPIALGQIPLTGGAGQLDTGGAGLSGPMRGYYWDVKRLVAASFTAGTVTAYINLVQDANIFAVWPSAGLYTFGRGEGLLTPQDRLIFTASSITGLVTISGAAIQFGEKLLPYFLGLG